MASRFCLRIEPRGLCGNDCSPAHSSRGTLHALDRSERHRTAALNELFIEKFGQYLHRCRCPHYGRSLIRIKTNGARLFLSYLHNVGVVSATLSRRRLQSHSSLRRSINGCASSEEPVVPRYTAILFRFGDCSDTLKTIRAGSDILKWGGSLRPARKID